MSGVSQKLYVLVEALLYISHNTAMQPLGGKKLASILDVPPRYLEPLLQSLVRAHILRSVRGPRGGYMLAKDQNMIRMDEVLQAIEADRQEKYVANFSDVNHLLVQPLFHKAQTAYYDTLGTITLNDLAQDAKEKGLDHIFTPSKNDTTIRLDYNI